LRLLRTDIAQAAGQHFPVGSNLFAPSAQVVDDMANEYSGSLKPEKQAYVARHAASSAERMSMKPFPLISCKKSL
jgi:hypothetical protein